MRKLLLLSSVLLVLLITVVGCKVKSKAEKKEAVSQNEVVEEKITEEGYRIHKPGVINQQELDSIKSVKMKEKLKGKIDK